MITINEKVIYDIYLGKINSMIIIFHELNHFKVFYDLRLEKINFDLIRIAKEELIRLSEDDNEKQTEFIVDKSQYYVDNYKLYSEEKFVDLVKAHNKNHSCSVLESMNSDACQIGDDIIGKVKIPLIGYVEPENASLGLIAMIIGLVDGFNPCAMWVLFFLLSILINMKDRKRMWAIGLTFLLTSALV